MTYYILRIGGTSEFVSKIDPDDRTCSPPGSIETVSGWEHDDALRYDTEEEAEAAKILAEMADGCHVCVEEIKRDA